MYLKIKQLSIKRKAHISHKYLLSNYYPQARALRRTGQNTCLSSIPPFTKLCAKFCHFLFFTYTEEAITYHLSFSYHIKVTWGSLS